MSGSARAVRWYRLAFAAIAIAALGAVGFLWLRAALPSPQRLESQPRAGEGRRPAKPHAETPKKESRDEQAPVPLIARTPRDATASPRGVVGTSKTDRPAVRDRGRDEPAALPHRELEALRDAPAEAAPSVLPSPPDPRPVAVPSEAATGESIAVQQIQQVLTRYEQAYDRLDASAAAAVWPSVDRNGLERAFARLREQDLEFNRCVFGVSSDDATVTCSGELRYVRRFGNALPRVEAHSWVIQFRHVGGEWRIVSVVGR
jgi:hypothetical protein